MSTTTDGIDNKAYKADPSDLAGVIQQSPEEDTASRRTSTSSSNSTISDNTPGIPLERTATVNIADEISSNGKASITQPVKHEPGDIDSIKDEKERDMWDNPVEFLLSCIAMSVGLGNVWRFPTVAFENGGGAFLVPYLIVLFFIGRPMYFLEMSIGQFSSGSAVKVWKMVPAMKGIGYAQAIGSGSVVSYYCSIIAIAIFYFINSFKSVLPWSECSADWGADEYCVEAGQNTTGINTTLQFSAEQYFKKFVLHQPEDLSNGPGSPDWRLTLCLAATWLLMLGALIRGVKSSGKVAYVTALFPYIGLITLLIKGSTLPGASEGMMYFITPQWEKIGEPQVWYAAVGQSFFSLSVAFGPIVMFSSHNSFRQNIYRDSTIISLMDTFTSLLAGFTIFGILGYLKHVTGAENFEDVVSGGTALVFVTYPTAIAAFETAPQVFSVLFFLVLITLGLGSSTALTSMVVSLIADKFDKVPRVLVTIGVCAAGFLIGLVYVTPGGQWILDLVDFFGGTFLIYIIAIAEVVAVFWIYGLKKYIRDIHFMLAIKLGFYWKFCLAFFTPVFLTIILVYFLATFNLPTYTPDDVELYYPTIGYVCGWLLCSVALVFMVVCFIHEYTRTTGDSVTDRIKKTFLPGPKHGPRLTDDHRAWTIFCKEGGEDRMDRWKAISKEALQDPLKLAKFNEIYGSVAEDCRNWDVIQLQDESIWTKAKKILCS